MSDIDISKFANYLNEKASGIDSKLSKAIELCCRKIHDDIQYSMAHTSVDTSKAYFTNNKTKAHYPSLPGNPPAVDTGRLRGSINYEIHDESKEIYGVVGSTLKDPDYAVYTEYGTSKMKPRPWLKPAMIKNNDFIRTSIIKAIKNVFTGGN